MAHLHNGHFIPRRYEYFTCRWNKYVDWSRSSKALNLLYSSGCTVCHLASHLHDDGINTTYDLQSAEGVGQLLQDCYRKDRIYLLPFNQLPGLVLTSNSEIRHDLGSCVAPLLQSQYTSDICIHIRRGDVNPLRHRSWFIDDNVYASIIRKVLISKPNTRIRIISQLNSDGSRPLEQLASEFGSSVEISISESQWTNNDEVDAFAAMLNCKILIGGRSSFCQTAYYLSLSAQRFICLVNGSDAGFLPPRMMNTFDLAACDDIANMVLEAVHPALEEIKLDI